MGKRPSDSYPPEVRAQVDECVRLFSDGVEAVTAHQMRDILRAADEGGITEACADCLLDNNPRLGFPVHDALQELWGTAFME